MSNYATVEPTFWTGETGRKLRQLGQEAQLVALYLVTNSHRNSLGLYYLPKMLISHETALTEEGASKGLLRGIQAGFCIYDDTSEVVWVKKMAIYQIGPELKVNDKRVKWISEIYKSLPNNPFLYDFWTEYGAKFHIEKPRGIEGASKALQSPIEDPSKPITTTTTTTTTKRSLVRTKSQTAPPDFEAFWSIWPRKVRKQAALRAWNGANGTRPPIEKVIAKVNELKKTEQWQNSKYIPHPATWINGGGWDDEVTCQNKSRSYIEYRKAMGAPEYANETTTIPQ